ncbi:uncharacterized protein VTP21DRAFT_7211 [Calcarisporiella thermophila]|uniref:uncharacterized protein n=1 Tax=Calcarisporiella thermophila TaxID=911321 RepID=UPI0037443A92
MITSLEETRTSNMTLVLGIVVAILNNLFQSLGMTLQRKSHIANDALPENQREHPLRRPMWLIGFISFVLASSIGAPLTISLLPVVVVGPLGACSLIFNALFAKLLLSDPFTARLAGGTVLIVTGAILIALFGAISEPNHSLYDLIQLYKRTTFIAFFAIEEILLAGSLIATEIAERALWKERRLNDERFNSEERKSTLIGISYAFASGVIGSQSLIFAKSGIELLALTILEGKNQFDKPLTWVIVGLLFFTIILQLYYLNKGLRFCSTVLLAPLAFCTYNVATLVNGLIYYDQLHRLNWWRALLVFMGAIVVTVGVMIVSWGPGSYRKLAGWEKDNEEECYNESTNERTPLLSTPPPASPHKPDGPPRLSSPMNK